jgi:hypothetical protein
VEPRQVVLVVPVLHGWNDARCGNAARPPPWRMRCDPQDTPRVSRDYVVRFSSSR